MTRREMTGIANGSSYTLFQLEGYFHCCVYLQRKRTAPAEFKPETEASEITDYFPTSRTMTQGVCVCLCVCVSAETVGLSVVSIQSSVALCFTVG